MVISTMTVLLALLQGWVKLSHTGGKVGGMMYSKKQCVLQVPTQSLPVHIPPQRHPRPLPAWIATRVTATEVALP